MSKTYKNPAVTVDILIFAKINDDQKVLLIKRKNPPFQDKWAIPGGFVEYDEDLEDAAKRELEEETSVKDVNLEQLRAFGTPGRDPRSRTISIVYYTQIDAATVSPKAQDDAKEVQWFSMNNLPDLAFDHAEILDYAKSHIKKSEVA